MGEERVGGVESGAPPEAAWPADNQSGIEGPILEQIEKRAARVIWLNPLLGNDDYRPLARGMSAALPHVSLFASAHNLASLQALGRYLAL